MERKKNSVVFLTLCILSLSGFVCAASLGTAFTYQGWLVESNNAAEGNYDFLFKLYDASSGGSQVGSSVSKTNVGVVNGDFAVELDFGSNAFNGNAVWLEIGVRHAGESLYTTISPRVKVTPAPYAVYALTSGSASGADNDWMISGNDMYSVPSGNVGIGTTTPQSSVKLEVRNSMTGGAGIASYVTGDDGAAVFGMAESGAFAAIQGNGTAADYAGYFQGDVHVTGNLTTGSSGNVGIGANSSDENFKLRVDSSDSGAGIGCYIDGDATTAIFAMAHPDAITAIHGNANGASYAGYFTGNVYVTGNVSAQSFTDRTPYPKDLVTAYEAVLSMKRLPEGQYSESNKETQLDHSTLNSFIQSEDGNRDLSATVSCQNEVIKDLIRRTKELEAANTTIQRLEQQILELQEQNKHLEKLETQLNQLRLSQ